MDLSAHAVEWLNRAANSFGTVLLAPIPFLPGWLSLTLISAASAGLMLLTFKHTSNQIAIKQARNQIRANLLALSLFKDEFSVSLRAQRCILRNAMKMFFLSLVPMLVTAIPTILALGQLGLWYEARPFSVGEEAVIVIHVAGGEESQPVELQTNPAWAVVTGPVHVRSQREICWNVVCSQPGNHRLNFQVGGKSFEKELAVGDGFMRVSRKRPGLSIAEQLLHPRERPLAASEAIQSIEMQYPERSSRICGTNSWLMSWFLMSMGFAFILRRPLHVEL